LKTSKKVEKLRKTVAKTLQKRRKNVAKASQKRRKSVAKASQKRHKKRRQSALLFACSIRHFLLKFLSIKCQRMPIVVMTEIVGMEWRQKNVSTPWL
jgi:flagellar biosynthesis component FlhA